MYFFPDPSIDVRLPIDGPANELVLFTFNGGPGTQVDDLPAAKWPIPHPIPVALADRGQYHSTEGMYGVRCHGRTTSVYFCGHRLGAVSSRSLALAYAIVNRFWQANRIE